MQTCLVAQIFVRLSAEPGALERALQPFTVSGYVPVRLSMRKSRSDGMFVTARYLGIDVDRAINLAVRLRAMPCARGVRISVRPSGGGQDASRTIVQRPLASRDDNAP